MYKLHNMKRDKYYEKIFYIWENTEESQSH